GVCHADVYNTGACVLGEVQFVKVSDNVIIANMVGQSGVIETSMGGKSFKPIRYTALAKCMEEVFNYISQNVIYPRYDREGYSWSIHAPKFGSLRAGGNLAVIEQMIYE